VQVWNQKRSRPLINHANFVLSAPKENVRPMPFPFRKKREIFEISGPAKLALLGSTPVRNPTLEWAKGEDGRVVLLLPRKRTSSIVRRVFRLQPFKRVRFDVMGSFVWELCDGKRTVGDIIQEIQKTYSLTRKEAETPLLAHLDRLQERRMIGMLREVDGRQRQKRSRREKK